MTGLSFSVKRQLCFSKDSVGHLFAFSCVSAIEQKPTNRNVSVSQAGRSSLCVVECVAGFPDRQISCLNTLLRCAVGGAEECSVLDWKQ